MSDAKSQSLPQTHWIWGWGSATHVLASPAGDPDAPKFENQPRGQRHQSGIQIISLQHNTIQWIPISLLAKPKVFVTAFKVLHVPWFTFTCLTSFAPPPTVPVTHFTSVMEAASDWRTYQACICLNAFFGVAS